MEYTLYGAALPVLEINDKSLNLGDVRNRLQSHDRSAAYFGNVYNSMSAFIRTMYFTHSRIY